MGRHVADIDILVGRATSAITQRRGGDAAALGQETEADDGLLFLGNPHETVPRALLIDKRLGAVDVLGWQMIHLLSNVDRTTAFPTYDQLQPLLRSGAGKQASRGTVARVMAILRLTRWMSLCHRARNDTNGRVIGNVYVLHDEPVTPTEANMLDSEYFAFVRQSCGHKNSAVRDVATTIRTELEGEGVILQDLQEEPSAPNCPEPSPLERLNRRARRFEEMQPSSHRELGQFSRGEAQFSGRTQSGNNDLEHSSQGELSGGHERTAPSSQSELSLKSGTYRLVPIANSAPTTVRSSNHLRTTCKGNDTPPSRRDLFWSDLLHLQPGDRSSLADVLSMLPDDLQQAVLDETAGKVAAGKSDNPRGLLHALIKRAAAGEFRVTQHAQQQAERRGERYITDTPDSHKPRSPGDTPPAGPVPANRPVSPEPAVTRREAEAARAEMLASLGIQRR